MLVGNTERLTAALARRLPRYDLPGFDVPEASLAPYISDLRQRISALIRQLETKPVGDLRDYEVAGDASSGRQFWEIYLDVDAWYLLVETHPDDSVSPLAILWITDIQLTQAIVAADP